MKTKELEKEGITKEFLNSLRINNLGNPVQLLPNDEPVNLLKCANGFWISINSQVVKDKDNNYIVVKNEDALIARARYLINFQEEIKKQEGELYKSHLENQIKDETKRLQELTKTTVKGYLSKIKTILQLAGLLETDFEFILQKMIFEKKHSLEEKIIEAKDIASQPDYLSSYEDIKKMYDNEDLDNLYCLFFQKGIPQIASFQTPDLLNNTDIDVFIKYFHRDKLENTISDIQSKSHIENVARFIVEKKNANPNQSQ